MKLLLDENLSPAYAERLRAIGVDAVAVNELGLSGASDTDVAKACLELKRVLVTLDADFSNTVRYPPERTSGVVRFRIHPPTNEAIWKLFEFLLSKLRDFDFDKKLVVLEKERIRIRG